MCEKEINLYKQMVKLLKNYHFNYKFISLKLELIMTIMINGCIKSKTF